MLKNYKKYNKEIAELKEEVKRFRERFEIIDPNED